MFERKLSLQQLIDLCRVLRHHLSAGLTLRDCFKQQAERGPARLRPFAQRIRTSIEMGNSLSASLEEEKNKLPPLFLAMAKVGEQTGHIAEMFGNLEQHYLREQKLRREFWKNSFLPIVQFILAILLVGGLIFILGVIGQSRNTTPLSLFGLTGGRGAIIFLTVMFGSITTVWLFSYIFLRGPRQAAPVQAILMKVPSLGPCIYAVVMSRFTMALKLTLDSGLSIVKALKLSLEATGNAHFVAQSATISDALKSGESLLDALTKSQLFDDHFLQMVAAGEEGGRVPEMMEHQAEYYHEESSRRLMTLTKVFSGLIWLIYACFMVYTIFQIASLYISALG